MGVDTGLVVTLISSENSTKNITVSNQDNSMASLFYDTNISYTSIKFDKENLLTPEENDLLEMKEISELAMETKVMPAKKMDALLKKIWTRLYNLRAQHLNLDLQELRNTPYDDERKKMDQFNKISNYFGFLDSLGILRGIVKTAANDDLDIKIVAEFY